MSWTVLISNGVGFDYRNRYRAYLKAKEVGEGNFLSVFNNSDKHKVYHSLKELQKDIFKVKK